MWVQERGIKTIGRLKVTLSTEIMVKTARRRWVPEYKWWEWKIRWGEAAVGDYGS